MEVDCGPNEGGFHCVPGFQKHILGKKKFFRKNSFI
jgi:hypothetical protein